MFQKCSREGLAGIKPHCSQFSIQKHFHLCITVLASLSYMESLCSLHVIKAFHCVSSMSKNATSINSYELSSTLRYLKGSMSHLCIFVYKISVLSNVEVSKGFLYFGFYRSGDVYTKIR